MKGFISILRIIFAIFILAALSCNDDNFRILFQDGDLTSIRIIQKDYSIPKGLELNYSIIGTYLDGSTRSLSDSAVWSSSDTLVANIGERASSDIFATANNVGTTTISVTVGPFSDSTLLIVTPPELVSIAVTPVDASVAKGLTLQYTAIGTYTDCAQPC